MFRRLILEDWQRSLSILGWAMFAFVFIATGLRAVFLSEEEAGRLGSLPLEEDSHE
jgi:hypothetical protein